MTQRAPVAEAARLVCGCIAVQKLLDVLCREAVRVTGSRAAVASCAPRDQRGSAALLGASVEWAGGEGPPAALRSALFGLLRRVSATRAPVVFSASARPGEPVLAGLSAIPQMQDGAIVAIPVMAAAGKVAALLVVAGADSPAVRADDLAALEELACCAAQALSTMTLLGHARADQQRLRMFAAAAAERDVLWSWDVPGDRVWWSSETFGCPAALRGQPLAWKVDRIHPEDVARVHTRLQDVLQSDASVWTDSYRIRHKDRSWVLVEDHGYIVRDAAGQPVSCFGLMRDITDRSDYRQLSNLNDELAHRVLHDPLTDLPNRVLLLDRLQHALTASARRRSAVGVCLVDIDHFKRINDGLGHAVGDRVLVEVAGRLAGVVRSTDTVGRLAGDEFVVVLDGVADAEQAASLVTRMLRAIEAPIPLGGRDLVVAVSIGVALAGDDGGDAERLLADADAALYHAKQGGRGRHELFDTAMRAYMTERLETETDLRHALDASELRLAYQPQVDLASGRIVGLEALLRWEHPERGLMLPRQFLSLAEDSGLIVPIGLWTIKQACRSAALRAPDPALAGLVVWVNLCNKELTQPGLVDYVAETLAETQTEPSKLGIEITESALVDAGAVEPVLSALRRLGVQVAIDDFGTGFSSLSYLRTLPVDVLKIDRSFVAGLGRGPEDTAIVRAIVSLARALDMRALAEGVETPEQAATLHALGCDLAQGFFFGRPGTLDALHGALAA